MTNSPLDGLLEPIDDSESMAKIQEALKEATKLRNGEIPDEEQETVKTREPKHVQEESENEEESDNFMDMEESHEHEEVDVELEPEHEEKVEKREKRSEKDKFRKLQNDKHRLKAEKAAAEDRIRELENQLTQSLSAGTYYYGKTAYDELERAKEAQSRALDEGDKAALQKATEDMISAKITIKELEKWANESSKTSPPHQVNSHYQAHNQLPYQQPIDPDIQYKQEMVSDWLDSHPYINPESKKYNPNIATKVTRFIKNMDKEGTYAPYTPDYFDEIDDYIDRIKSRKSSATLPPVGGVRNSYAAKGVRSNSSQEAPLTPEELAHIKSMASLGVTEESYRKYKQEGN